MELNQMLLEIIIKRSKDDFEKFCTALRMTGQKPLAYILQNGAGWWRRWKYLNAWNMSIGMCQIFFVNILNDWLNRRHIVSREVKSDGSCIVLHYYFYRTYDRNKNTLQDSSHVPWLTTCRSQHVSRRSSNNERNGLSSFKTNTWRIERKIAAARHWETGCDVQQFLDRYQRHRPGACVFHSFI